VNGDERPELVSVCAGREGINLIVRSAADRRLCWHGYYALGYDIEPDCTEDDLGPR